MLKINDIKEVIEFSENNHVRVDLHIGFGFSEKWVCVSSEKGSIYLDLEDIDSLTYTEDLNYWLNNAANDLESEV